MNNSITVPSDFRTVDLNTFPPQYSYPRKYWSIPVPAKQIEWLLDQNRMDDAVVYAIYAIGPSFAGEIPFLTAHPECDEIVNRLRAERRVKLFHENKRTRYKTTELVLGPNADVKTIIEDVAFLSEPRHPWYSEHPQESA